MDRRDLEAGLEELPIPDAWDRIRDVVTSCTSNGSDMHALDLLDDFIDAALNANDTLPVPHVCEHGIPRISDGSWGCAVCEGLTHH